MDDGSGLGTSHDGAGHRLAVELLTIELLDRLEIFLPGPAAVFRDLDSGRIDEVLAIHNAHAVGRDGQSSELTFP